MTKFRSLRVSLMSCSKSYIMTEVSVNLIVSGNLMVRLWGWRALVKQFAFWQKVGVWKYTTERSNNIPSCFDAEKNVTLETDSHRLLCFSEASVLFLPTSSPSNILLPEWFVYMYNLKHFYSFAQGIFCHSSDCKRGFPYPQSRIFWVRKAWNLF